MKNSLETLPEIRLNESSISLETLPPATENSSSTSLQPAVANLSGLLPVGHAVLLLPYQPEYDAAKRAGLAIPDEDFRMGGIMTEMRAVVVALGPDCWRNDNDTVAEREAKPWRPRALPGDKVMVSKFSGAVVHGPLDGKVYRMVNDQDIFVKIVAEAEKPLFNH